MIASKTNKKELLHRLKIVQGQVAKIADMVEHDEYCIDILHNSRSCQKALKTVDMIIMEDHLKTCAVDQARRGETEKLVKDLVGIYKFK